jgi:hypothetical protein
MYYFCNIGRFEIGVVSTTTNLQNFRMLYRLAGKLGNFYRSNNSNISVELLFFTLAPIGALGL